MSIITNLQSNLPILLRDTDPALRIPAQIFEGTPEEALAIAETLKKTLIAYKALGLAGPQIGYPFRVFAFGDPKTPESVAIAFNPQIVNTSDDSIRLEEGCLSFPGLFLRLLRKRTIRARWTQADGVTDTMQLSGISARVFQHEYDHLDGILFTDLAGPVELGRGRQKQKQLFRRLKKKYHTTGSVYSSPLMPPPSDVAMPPEESFNNNLGTIIWKTDPIDKTTPT